MFDWRKCCREFEVTMKIWSPDILTIAKKEGLRRIRVCEFKEIEAWAAWKDITKKDTWCSFNIARIFVSFWPNENFAPYKVTIINEDGLILKEIDDAGSILDFCKRYHLLEDFPFANVKDEDMKKLELDKSCSNVMDQSGLEGFDEKASKITETGFDKITHPSHYCEGRRYEPKDVIADWKLDFFLGNTLKYISRAGRKDSETFIEDLEKARQYLDWEISLRKGDFWHGKK